MLNYWLARTRINQKVEKSAKLSLKFDEIINKLGVNGERISLEDPDRQTCITF